MLYEYHFWKHQYYDPAVIRFARVIHNDIVNYKKNGLNGLIEDGSQRSFFPNGFPFFVYGQTQFDTSLKFEDLLEDYFSHAYGDDWREVLRIFENIAECFDHKYMEGVASVDIKVGRYYNPTVANKLRKVPAVINEAIPFIEAHKNMPMRAQTVAYKLLRYHMDFCVGIAKCFAMKCVGGGEEASEEFKKFLLDFGKHEAEIERWYDQALMAYSLGTCGIYRKEKATPTTEDRWTET